MGAFIFCLLVALWLGLWVRARLSVRAVSWGCPRVVVSWFIPRSGRRGLWGGGRWVSVSWVVGRRSYWLWWRLWRRR